MKPPAFSVRDNKSKKKKKKKDENEEGDLTCCNSWRMASKSLHEPVPVPSLPLPTRPHTHPHPSLEPHPSFPAGLCTLRTRRTSDPDTRSPSMGCSSTSFLALLQVAFRDISPHHLFKTATVLPAPTLYPFPQCIPHSKCLLRNEIREAESVHQAPYQTNTQSHLEPRKCLRRLNIKEGLRPSLTGRPWAQYHIDTALSSACHRFQPSSVPPPTPSRLGAGLVSSPQPAAAEPELLHGYARE